MYVVGELFSLTHAQLSEPSIQLTALPCTTHYTFMHNISMPHYSPSFLSSGRIKKSKVTNLISILTLRPSLHNIFSSYVWPPESLYYGATEILLRPSVGLARPSVKLGSRTVGLYAYSYTKLQHGEVSLGI